MLLSRFLHRHQNVVRVRVARSQGSAPRDAGTEMFVTQDTEFGTIGGGQLEYMALDEARSMLARGRGQATMDIPLGPEIGQCCGGRVELSLDIMDRGARAEVLSREVERLATLPHVYVFGAGHVGRALARCLEALPVHAILIDERADELRRCDAQIESRQSSIPESEIKKARPGSAFVVLTHDHALDFMIAAEALSRADAAYVGMIGSATKRAKFARYCKTDWDGLSSDELICPIGAAGSDDKRPEVIAAFVAAEVIATLTHIPDSQRAMKREGAELLPSATPQI